MVMLKTIKDNPFVYRSFKTIQSFIYRKKKKYNKTIELYNNIQIENVAKTKLNFFGYYNIHPDNKFGDVLFCNIIKQNYKESISINSKNYGQILNSNTWNFQQGCMLNWFTDDEIIFNDFDNQHKRYISIIYNLLTKKQKIMGFPIYSLSSNRKFSLSLNYERLAKFRPDYGYFFNCKNIEMTLANDGLFYLDIKNNTTKLIYNFENIFKDVGLYSYEEFTKVRLNHIDISPDNTKAIFLLRWVHNNTPRTRLILFDIMKNQLRTINGDEMVSHCCWYGNNKIISYGKIENNNCYAIFNIDNNNYEILDKLPKVDGHPSLDKNNEWLITDTYPDKYRMSKLYLYHLKSKKIYCLGKFYQPPKYVKQTRIDLHPKWSLNGDIIYFESGHDGYRKLYQLSLKEIINEKNPNSNS